MNFSSAFFNKQADRLFVLALLLIFFMANFSLLFGNFTCVWDALSYFSPHYRLIANFAREGKLIFWNPWLIGGSPEYLNPEIGALSLFTFFFSLITGPGSRGFIVYWLTLWFMGGAGMYCLARWLKAPPWGAFIASLGFLVSGFYTGHAEHTSLICTFSFFPIVLWRWDVFLVTGRLLAALQAGVFFGISTLGGYPGLVIILGLYVLLWTIGRCILPEFPEVQFSFKKIYSYFPGIVLFLLLIVLIAGPTYFSFLSEGRGYTNRSNILSREDVINLNSLHPAALSTLASPILTFFKNYPTDVSSRSIYLSPLCLIFAIYALINFKSNKFALWILALSFFSLGSALSQTFPLRGWLYDFVPPMRFFRHSAIFRGPFIFSLVILSIIGFRNFSQKALPDSPVPVKNFIFSGLIAFLLTGPLYLLMILKPLTSKDFLFESFVKTNLWVAHTHLLIVWISLIFTAFFFYRSRSSRFGPLLFVVIAITDFCFAAYLSSPTVRQPMDQELGRLVSQYSTSLDLSAKGFERSHELSRSMELNNIISLSEKIPCLNNYTDFTNPYFSLMNQDPITVNMATGKDRIWFTKSTVVIPPSVKAYEAFSTRIHKLNHPILIIHSRKDLETDNKPSPRINLKEIDRISQLPPAQRMTARVITYKPEELIFEVDCPDKGWLLVTDRYAKSWKVKVNGLVSPVWGGNFIYRAIPVEAGIQKITFTYKPFGILFLTFLSWGIIVFIMVISCIRCVNIKYFPKKGMKTNGKTFGALVRKNE